MSGRTYQQLHRYRGSLYGSPQFSGLEYDYEVPDNVVVASPGGVSTTQHHYTKGFYGNGASTYDIFGGEGNMYPYGELGNLYQYGQNAPTEMGMYQQGADQMYTGNQSTAHVENFQHTQPGMTPVPGMELLTLADTAEQTSVGVAAARTAIRSELKDITHKIHLPNPWLVLLMIVLLYIALDLFTTAGETVLFARFHGGKTPEWKWLLFYSAIFVGLALALGSVFQDPLLALKRFDGDPGAGGE